MGKLHVVVLIYWIVSKGYPCDDLRAIAAFCLADETYSEIPFPKSCNLTHVYCCQLLVLGGKLAIFLQNKGEIWLMNEFGVRESWTKISLHGINKIPLFKQDRMMVYEIEKGTFSETACVWNPKNFSVIGSYVESLVSLKHNITEQKSTNSSEEEEEEDAEDEDEDVENEDLEDEDVEDALEDEEEEDAEEEDVENEDVEHEDVEDAAEDEGKKDDRDTCKAIRADLEFSGEQNTHPERQTGKRKDIGSSNVPSKHARVNSYSGSADIPKPSSRELLEGLVPPHLAQENLGINNDDLCHGADTDLFNNLHSFESIRQNMQATGDTVDTLSRDIKEKNVMILALERTVSRDYDSWKAKHLEEKLRADRLEGEVNHALGKQKLLTHRLEENEATIQSKLAEIQALVEKNEVLLERSRALDTANAKIESLNAKLAIADHERWKAMAALQSWQGDIESN